MTNTPSEYYLNQCNHHVIKEDSFQLSVLKQFDQIHQQIMLEQKKRARLFSSLRKPKLIKGLYLWGQVGIGKTFLMDCFYKTLSFPEKKRIHFHLFMQFIHQELTTYQGKKNPLAIIAKQLAKKVMVLCFDEFTVTDITDAMLLGRLFDSLFKEGICLIATSNVSPDDLYKNGLQRKLFIPTIESIKKNTTVIHLTSTKDYRLHSLKNSQAFYTPNDEMAEFNMQKIFDLLSQDQDINEEPIIVNDRSISVIKSSKYAIWFDYQYILLKPRSQADYISLSKQYQTILISNIPQILSDEKDKILLLIRMIDVFYDAHTRLILSSQVSMDKIYETGPMQFEYQRTLSRLTEMQSKKYFEHCF